jgi:hypothetical protein
MARRPLTMVHRPLPTVALLAVAACGQPSALAVVINHSSYTGFDAGVAQAMTERVCPGCGMIRIELVDECPTGSHGEIVHGGGKSPRICLALTRDDQPVCETSLAHELIHWRLLRWTGDANGMHDAVDWALQPTINEEFEEQ